MGTWIINPRGTHLLTKNWQYYSVSNGYRIVSRRVHSQSYLAVSRRNFPTVTGLRQSTGHAPHKVETDSLFEGHVPQGVEVQVLSSALARVTCWMDFSHHVPGGIPFRHMVFYVS